MNVFKYTKEINNTGLRVMSPSLHQSCIIIILFTSYKSHIVSIVCPCWDEQGKLLGHPHGSTLHNLLGLGHFWQCSYTKNSEALQLEQYKIVKNVAFFQELNVLKNEGVSIHYFHVGTGEKNQAYIWWFNI